MAALTAALGSSQGLPSRLLGGEYLGRRLLPPHNQGDFQWGLRASPSNPRRLKESKAARARPKALACAAAVLQAEPSFVTYAGQSSLNPAIAFEQAMDVAKSQRFGGGLAAPGLSLVAGHEGQAEGEVQMITTAQGKQIPVAFQREVIQLEVHTGLPPTPYLRDIRPASALGDLADTSMPKFELPPGEETVLDAAKVLTPAKASKIKADISRLEASRGWRLRILTRYAPGSFDTEEIRSYWKPDDRTLIVICDVTSPNILNFNTGDDVRTLLPRQFFIELQSRFGNRFYVGEEGEQAALVNTVSTLVGCLSADEGCQRVPGLSDDLFFLTVGTSIAGGAVFGFALRQEPTSQVTATWQ